ncbi:MAG: PINc/VapC family ATPase [Candidatus Aenigmatarchaeota archaeon]
MKKRNHRPIETEIKLERVVPDTSAIVKGLLSRLAEQGKLDGSTVIIPEIVMGELQAQASRGKETGFLGLEEIKKIREMSQAKNITLVLTGERPSFEDIQLAKSGRIDALIQDWAKKEKAVLITSDLPQALVAEAQGIPVKYFEAYEAAKTTKLEELLTPETMSLHLKEGVKPMAKRGKPGAFKLVEIRETPMSTEEMDAIQKEVLDAARYEEQAYMEIGEYGASVVQLRNMRIAIARPPFSDGLEITAVRPIIKLALSDYSLSEKLRARLETKAEGILVAGPPGSGKSTFAAALAEFYFAAGNVVKTMEQPRDLQVSEGITQYAPLDGSFAKTADILLLVRPDYTIFDEVRKTRDFEIFADMRLAGVGMVGVVHASDPVDAVQRFIGRVELGVIPHIVDTIVFIRSGAIEKSYELTLLVRVPTGMTEADLARPLVEVRDFENGKLEYEIYTYGDQTVVIPVTGAERKPAAQRLAAEKVMEEIRRWDPQAQVEFLSDDKVQVKVANDVIPKIIGKEGKTVKALEQKLGVSIDVAPAVAALGKEVHVETGQKGNAVSLYFEKHLFGKTANVYIESEYLFTATVGRKGEIRVAKGSDIGDALMRAAATRRPIRAFI